jgi:hypothetical protein
LWTGSGDNARQNPLHILIGGRLIPRVRRPCRIMLLKHDSDRLGIHFLRLREQTIGFRIVAHGLLVKALLCESAGLDRFVVFPPAIRHGFLPCR